MSHGWAIERGIIDGAKAELRRTLEAYLRNHEEVDDAHILHALCEFTATAGFETIGKDNTITMFRRVARELRDGTSP